MTNKKAEQIRIALREYVMRSVNEAIDMVMPQIEDSLASGTAKGEIWQDEFVELIEARHGEGSAVFANKRHDFEVGSMKVQCKWLEQINKNGDLQLDNLRHNRANGGVRGYVTGEFDVLALKHQGEHYLIPEWRLVNWRRPHLIRKRIKPKNYRDYIDNWSIFDGAFSGELSAQLADPQKKLFS